MRFLLIPYDISLLTTVTSILSLEQEYHLSRVFYSHILYKDSSTYPVFSPFLSLVLKRTGTGLSHSRWPSHGQMLETSASLLTTTQILYVDCGQRLVTIWIYVTSFILQSTAHVWNASLYRSTLSFNLEKISQLGTNLTQRAKTASLLMTKTPILSTTWRWQIFFIICLGEGSILGYDSGTRFIER